MVKRILRRVLYVVLCFIGLIGLYAALAFLLPHIKVNRDFTETGDSGVTIYLCSNGVHTDIAMPVNTPYIDWRKEFPPASFKAVDSTFQYVEVGWGDKGFFLNTPTWADLKFSTAFKAALSLDSSAMHVTYDKLPPRESAEYAHKIVISGEQYKKLIGYIENTFDKPNGHVMLIGKATTYGLTDNFYDAHGNYSVLKTCNVWTCGALKAAGIKHAIWSPFQGGVMNGYDPAK